jgi:hypothetical protein
MQRTSAVTTSHAPAREAVGAGKSSARLLSILVWRTVKVAFAPAPPPRRVGDAGAWKLMRRRAAASRGQPAMEGGVGAWGREERMIPWNGRMRRCMVSS